MNKVYSKNKKAYHDFEMIECFEAGISLQGSEVKSVRSSNINLKGSYVSILENKVIIKNCHISRPPHLGNHVKFEELREKTLLLNKKEIRKLYTKVQEKGMTLIVTEVYQRENTKNIKAKICLAKGKREFDKRETLKRKQADIDTKRQMKDY